MYTQKGKPKDNKSRAVANSVSQNKNGGAQNFGLIEISPKNINQIKQQELTINSQETMQLKKNLKVMNNNIVKKEKMQQWGNNVSQFNGDKHYWCKTTTYAKWQYVKSFKNHDEANDWLKKNKQKYNIIEFGRGNSKTSYK